MQKLPYGKLQALDKLPWAPNEQKNWNTLLTASSDTPPWLAFTMLAGPGGSLSLQLLHFGIHCSPEPPAGLHPSSGQRAPPGNREPWNQVLPCPKPSAGLWSSCSSSTNWVVTPLGWSALGISVQVTLNTSLLFLGRLSKIQIALGAETSEVDLCDSVGLLGLIYMGVALCERSRTAPELPDSHTWTQKPWRGRFLCLHIFFFFNQAIYYSWYQTARYETYGSNYPDTYDSILAVLVTDNCFYSGEQWSLQKQEKTDVRTICCRWRVVG